MRWFFRRVRIEVYRKKCNGKNLIRFYTLPVLTQGAVKEKNYHNCLNSRQTRRVFFFQNYIPQHEILREDWRHAAKWKHLYFSIVP